MTCCPSCGRKLHIYDWRSECPGCGTNLNYYNSNSILLDEAEKAEKEHALFQPKVDRLKAAYAGSVLCIIRIILTLLPVGALFLPLINTESDKLSVLAVYELINAKGIGNIITGTFSSKLNMSATFLLLSAVLIIVSLILISMSLGKHGKLRVLLTYGITLLLSVLSLISLISSKNSELLELNGAKTSVSPGAGAFLYVALLTVLFLYNVFLLKKGIEVKYTPCFIGGLPSEEYFRLTSEGISKDEIQRKMLIALTELEAELDKKQGGETK